MKCNTCGSRTCFTHGVPWHTGLSCEEFDLVQSGGLDSSAASNDEKAPAPQDAYSLSEDSMRKIEERRATEETIKQTTKRCPNCGRNIEKNGGW